MAHRNAVLELSASKAQMIADRNVSAAMSDDQHRSEPLQRPVNAAKRALEKIGVRLRTVGRAASFPRLIPCSLELPFADTEAALRKIVDNDEIKAKCFVHDLRRRSRSELRAAADRSYGTSCQQVSRSTCLRQTARIQRQLGATLEATLSVPVGLTVAEIVEGNRPNHDRSEKMTF